MSKEKSIKKRDIRNFYIQNNLEEGPISYDEIVNNYITYFHNRALSAKKNYNIFSVLRIILLTIIGIIQVLPWHNEFIITSKDVTVMLTVLVAFNECIIKHFCSNEKWISSRSTVNKLIREQRIYKGTRESNECSTQSGEYYNQASYISRIEAILNDEEINWGDYRSKSFKHKEETE